MGSPKRFNWLIDLIRYHGYERGAEIGVHRGATTQQILIACPKVRLIAVDNWSFDPSARAMFFHRIARFANRVTVLQGDSLEMVKKVSDGSLDFVFIDADHSYEAALADIKAWTPKVKEDGIVCGHDYNHPRFPGVNKAVHECFSEDIGEGPDHVWYAEREDYLL